MASTGFEHSYHRYREALAGWEDDLARTNCQAWPPFFLPCTELPVSEIAKVLGEPRDSSGDGARRIPEPSHEHSVAQLNGLLRSRDVSAVQLAERALSVIEETDATLNAFITTTPDLALVQARKADSERAQGIDRGLLMGIPVAVKDVFATAGVRTTGGSLFLSNHVPDQDADVIVRLREAGSVLVGKTNMHEFGWGLAEGVGRVNNPLDPAYSASGSSGGSAAAVASGAVCVSIGTDSGGSVRVPASFCGVVGLKPSYGRVPSSGSLVSPPSLSHCGIFGRTVADVEVGFQALAGFSRTSDWASNDLRIGFLDSSLGSLDETVEDAVRTALARLKTSGIRVAPLSMADFELCLAPWMITFFAEMAEAGAWLAESIDELSIDMQVLLRIGADVRATAYLAAQRFRRRLDAGLNELLTGVDVLVTPTVPCSPWIEEPEWGDERYFGSMRFVVPLNLTGHPAITIPIPAYSLSAGLQLVGRHGCDEELLQAAASVETLLIDGTG